jgi:hypothetical protein
VEVGLAFCENFEKKTKGKTWRKQKANETKTSSK